MYKMFFLCCLMSMQIYSAFGENPKEEFISSVEALNSNSLGEIKSFAIFPLYSVPDDALRKGLYELIEKKLNTIGEIKVLAPPSVQGLGNAQAHLTLTYLNKRDVTEVSLYVNAEVSVQKTQKEAYVHIWSLTDLFQGVLSKKDEKGILEETSQMLDRFISDYKAANQDLRPIFYIYQTV